MMHRWLIAIAISFLLHAALGVYIVVHDTPEQSGVLAASAPLTMRLQDVRFSESPTQPEPTLTPTLSPLPMRPKAKTDIEPIHQETLSLPDIAHVDHSISKTTRQEKSEDTNPEESFPILPAAINEPIKTPAETNPNANHQEIGNTTPSEALHKSDTTGAEKTIDSSVNEHITQALFTDEGLLIVNNPTYVKRTKPVYPRRARDKNQQGTTLLEATLDEKGVVIDLKVSQSSGYRLLDKSAIKAVKKWQFKPAMHDGVAVMAIALVPIQFDITER